MTVDKPLQNLAFGVVDLVEKIYLDSKEKGLNGFVNNRQKDVEALLFEPFIINQENIVQYLSK